MLKVVPYLADFCKKIDIKKLKFSLCFRLMFFFVVISAIVWGIAGYISYKETRESIDEFFDTYQLALSRQLAAADWSAVSQNTQDVTDKLIKNVENADDDDDAIGFAIFTRDGKMIFHDDENGKYFPLNTTAFGTFVNERLEREGDKWRLLRLYSADGRYIITVGQELEYREDLAMDIVEEFLTPWLFGFIFLLLSIAGLTYFEFRPLKKLAASINNRSADDLAPVNMDNAPIEVKPLIGAMNHMFQKITNLLKRERSFISDSAHELRTPLTALKIQLEIAQMADDDAAMRQQALDKLQKGIERAERLVEQLLALSRLEADNGHYDNVEILNWNEICSHLIDEYSLMVKNKTIILEADDKAQPPFCTGNHILTALLIRNLLDNAVKYSPEKARITLKIADGKFTVTNSDTVVNENILQRLTERFFRPAGQKETGSGLGLAITERIAELYHCQLVFANTDEGFAVTIQAKEEI